MCIQLQKKVLKRKNYLLLDLYPTIGIGASKYCDGQVLVFDDLINLTTNDKKPKFVKNYFNFNKVASNVVKKYNREVKLKKFPSTKFTYN